MTVMGIITKHLKENGFDGLHHENNECGCRLNDLMPCDSEDFANCEPGYLRKDKQCDTCPEGYDYCVGKKKTEPCKFGETE